jgi:hypothetical protein
LVFCVAVLAALGAQLLCERPQKWGRRAAALLIAVGVADAWVICAPNYRYLLQPPTQAPGPAATFRQYRCGLPTPLTRIAIDGMGSINCGDIGYHVQPKDTVIGSNEKGYRGECYLLGGGKVTQTLWTPNRLSYEVNASEPTSLVVNQLLYPGWHLVHGDGSVYSEYGLIGVRVPPGRQVVELAYTPRHIRAAGAIAFFALAMLLAVWWIESHAAGRRHSHPG